MSSKQWKTWTNVLVRTLLASALVFSQSALAGQNQNNKATTQSVQKTTSQQPTAIQASGGLVSKTPAGERQDEVVEHATGKGTQEGIKVHGHWTIEVRNPDGSLVRRVEFENSLDPGFSYTFQGTTYQVPGGSALLSALLTGQAALPSWGIFLTGPGGLSNPTNTTNAPCNYVVGFDACFILQPSPTGCASTSITDYPGLSCNLSVLPLGTAPALTGLQLSGTVLASQSGQVSTVETAIVNEVGPPCPSGVTNCAFTGFGDRATRYASFTSSSNFPGAPISVSAGQTIAVTVSISFS